VLGSDKRWHAVETNKLGVTASGGSGKITEAIAVGKVDSAVYKRLREAAMEHNDPEKWKDFAAYALGVSRDEINVVAGDAEPSRSKININLTRGFDAEGKTAPFDREKSPWVQLGPGAFDRPANACSTLAHELVHAEHHTLTRDLVDKYNDYQQHHPGSKLTFREWAASKFAKTPEDRRKADIAAGMQDGALAATELEAHVEAAKVSFASGDVEQGRRDLLKVATRPVLPLDDTKDISAAALKALRDSLSGDALKAFDEVTAKAPKGSVLHHKLLQQH
jgi:hypothetical protein